MTDHVDAEERAERIRQLQGRRSGSAGAKRRHPAAATRWLLGGLSIASFFTIAGSVAVAGQSNVATTPDAPAQSTAAPAAPTATQSGSATPSPQSSRTTTAPAPHTTTRGS